MKKHTTDAKGYCETCKAYRGDSGCPKATPQHTPTPEVYGAYEDDRLQYPAIRLSDGGQIIALITLSGHRVAAELSPLEWRDRIVRAVNCHEEMLAALKRFYAKGFGLAMHTNNGRADLKALIAKAEGLR